MADESTDDAISDELPEDLQGVLNEILDTVEDDLVEELETIQGELDRARVERASLAEDLREKREEAEQHYGQANSAETEREVRRHASLAKEANSEAQDLADKVERLEDRIQTLEQQRTSLAKKMAVAELADDGETEEE